MISLSFLLIPETFLEKQEENTRKALASSSTEFRDSYEQKLIKISKSKKHLNETEVAKCLESLEKLFDNIDSRLEKNKAG